MLTADKDQSLKDQSLLPFRGEVTASRLQRVKKHDASITSLDLYGHEGGDDGADILAKLLKSRKKGGCRLEGLNMGANMIGNAGAASLAAALPANHTLTTLTLSLNRIGVPGAAALATGLRKNKTLRTLDLLGNCLGDEGAREIAGGLAVNNGVWAINLRQNEVRERGVGAMLEMLKVNRTLKTINLEATVWGSVHNCCMLRRDDIDMILSFGTGLEGAAGGAAAGHH